MQLQEHHAGLLLGGWTVAHPVLATAVGRLRWAASHLLFGLLGPAVALAAAGLAEGLAYGLVSGDVEGELPLGWPGRRWGCPRSGLAGIAAALFGLLPRLMAASGAVLARVRVPRPARPAAAA